jgi:hypothetical protein
LEEVLLLAMHLGEIESETENALDLLAILRSDTQRADVDHAQETAVSLTITLEHLLTHIQAFLPPVQKQLDIEP